MTASRHNNAQRVTMGGKGENGTTGTPPPSKEGPSLFNVIMLYLTLLGLGVIGGYGAFYLLFSERCVGLLQLQEVRYNTSMLEWQAKHQEAISEKDQCLSPLHQLQGKLEAQSTFAEKHQALLEKHEEALSKLSALQQTKEESNASQGKLRAQIGELQLELQRANQKVADSVKDKERVEQDLQSRLQQAKEELVQQAEKVDGIKGDQAECAAKLPELESDLKTVKSFVQNRAERMCRMEYGKGPFLIQFNVQFPDEENTEAFQVQLASLTEMPHTIFVLMELIHLKAYHGTVIKASEGTLDAGSPTDADKSVAVKVWDRLVKYGYEKPVSFKEHSGTFPHEEFTIGFVEAGPALAINTVDNTQVRGPAGRDDPCFGKVVSGFETLTRIQEAGGAPIEIVSVERVKQ